MPDKPKVLMIAPWSPFPWDAGSRRIWTACRSLRDRYDFYLLSFFNPMASIKPGPANNAAHPHAPTFNAFFSALLS